MGTMSFIETGKGKNATEAFSAAVSDALYEHGHGGYSGTLAEKHEFIVIAVPAGQTPPEFVEQLMENGDDRIEDKWGPAGCVAAGDGEYIFFGFASC